MVQILDAVYVSPRPFSLSVSPRNLSQIVQREKLLWSTTLIFRKEQTHILNLNLIGVEHFERGGNLSKFRGYFPNFQNEI